MISMNKEGKKITTNNARKVNQQKTKTTQEQFYSLAKCIERDHIKDQVHPVDMKKTRSDDAFVFLMHPHSFNIERIPFIKTAVRKSFIRKDKIGSDEKETYKTGSGHGIGILHLKVTNYH
jgi:hypothetical protein